METDTQSNSVNTTKLKHAMKCSEDFEAHWNRQIADHTNMSAESFGWGWDVSGVAYAVATAFCACALYASAYEKTNDQTDWFAFLKKNMPIIKQKFRDASAHHHMRIEDLFEQYNRSLFIHLSERKKQYAFAESSINKVDGSLRQMVDMTL